MNLEETVVFITWLNQYDPRVQLNAAARDMWHYSLGSVPVEDCRQAVLEHTKVNEVVATPGAIYKRAKAIQTSREASQRARMIEAAPSNPTLIKNPNSFRNRNPELWDQLFNEGRKQGNKERAINGAPYGAKPFSHEGELVQFNLPQHTAWADEPAA